MALNSQQGQQNLDPVQSALRGLGWLSGFNPSGQFVGWSGSTGNPVGGGNGIGPDPSQQKLTPIDRKDMGKTPKPIEAQAVDKIDKSRADQDAAIKQALAMFEGDMTMGTPGFMDRIREVADRITGPAGAAQAGIDKAEADQATIVADARASFNKIHDEFKAGLDNAQKMWEKQRDEFRDLSAQSVQNTVAGIKSSTQQAISQFRAQAAANGVPPDQIEAQVRIMDRDSRFQAGSIIGEASAATNSKIAEINANNAAIISGLQSQGLGALVTSSGQMVSAEVSAAVNTLNAYGKKAEVEVNAGGWLVGAEQFSANAITSLKTLQAQVAAGDRDAWLNFQTNWENLMQQWDAIVGAAA